MICDSVCSSNASTSHTPIDTGNELLERTVPEFSNLSSKEGNDVETGNELRLPEIIIPKTVPMPEEWTDDTENENAEPAQEELLDDVGSLTEPEATEEYLRCLGQLRWSSEKLLNLVSEASDQNPVHLKSAYAELIDTCDKVVTMLSDTKRLAVAGLKAVQNQSQGHEFEILESNTLLEHDPARRPSKLTRNQIRYAIHLGPCQPQLSIYPRNAALTKKGKQSSFSKTWFHDYPYLEYSVTENKAYCFVCSVFGKGGYQSIQRERSDKSWIEGIDDWSKMKGSRGKDKDGKLKTHFSCGAHTSALRDYTNFVCEGGQIDTLLTKQQRRGIIDSETEKEKNREVIEVLFDVAKTLARNGMAFRGNNTDEDGNFRQIVELLSRHNPVMKAWLDNRSARKYHTTYLSPQSQNEFISLLSEEVRSRISTCVKNAGFCSVMADTTPDVSHSDQLSVAVRYVDTESCMPKERLVRIAVTKDKTGAGQAEDIVKCLKQSDIPLSTVMFQTYDSTASMSGKFNGAQQKLSELLERKIPYTKCTPHGVNLVVEHGCTASPLIGKVFMVLEQLFVFFTSSTKRHEELQQKSHEVENYLQLRNLSKTRWTARPESVEAVWRSLEAILCALDSIKDSRSCDKESKTKALALINNIVNIDFICGIMFLKNVMYKTKLLADFLQGETVDIAGAIIAIESTQDCLQKMRVDDKAVDDQVQAAMAVARNIGADPVADFSRLHRIRRPSTRLDNQPESTAMELASIPTFYRTEFFKLIDQLCTTLMEKGNSLKDTFQPFLKVLHPESPGTVEDMRTLVAMFPLVLSQDSSAAIHSELAVFFEYATKEHKREQDKRQSEGLEAKPMTYTIAANIALQTARNHGLYRLAAKVYKLFLTAAPAVVTNERSFSLLKIVKSYSRNKISEERLNDCMILAAEKDITDAVDVNKLAKKWSILKNRRLLIE